MKKPLLTTGLVPGYPTPELSLEIAKTLRNAGADILELSASFSEPIADGPTLQLAHQKVLSSKFTKKDAFALYKKIKNETRAPLFLIEYANVIYQIGFDSYYKKAADSGINYILVPDVPLEESEPYRNAAAKIGTAHIFMIAPTSSDERVKRIVEQAQKYKAVNATTLPISTFLYLVSVTGVTGSRKDVSGDTLSFIKRVRLATDLPLIVGFGISEREHIQAVADAGADGVVTCSPIIDIARNLQGEPEKMQTTIARYVTSLALGL